MKQKINSKYLKCKEAYLDGFRERFSRAYHLGNKGEFSSRNWCLGKGIKLKGK